MKRRFLTVFFFLFAIPAFFAQSARDAVLSLAEIDALIEDTNYDAALLSLHDFIDVYPDMFDAAQKRVRHIMKVRGKYSEIAHTLIEVILHEPENDEKILAIIQELQSLEKNPTDRQLAFIHDAQVAAQFNVYRKQLLAILQESADLTHRDEYTAGAQKARSGFFMYQDDFFAAHDDEYALHVREVIENVDDTIMLFENIQPRMNNAVNSFTASVHVSDIAKAQASFAEVEKAYAEYATVRKSVHQFGATLLAIFESLKAGNPEITDASFLPFVSRYILGIQSIPDSGIAGAVDYEWNKLIERMKDEVALAIEAHAASFVAASSSMFSEVAAFPSVLPLKTISSLAAIGKSIKNLHALFNDEHDNSAEQNQFPNFYISLEYADFLFEHISALLDSSSDIVTAKRNAFSRAAPENPAAAEEAGSSYASSLLTSAEAIEKIVVRSADAAFASDARARTFMQAENTDADQLILLKPLADAYRKIAEDADTFKRNTITELWQRNTSYYALCGTTYVDLRKADYDEMMSSYNGVYDAATALTMKYPSKALALAAQLRESVASNKIVLGNAYTRLSQGEYVDSYRIQLRTIYDSMAQLDSFVTSISQIESSAAEQVRAARLAQNEAELRYSQAQTALASNSFDEARRRLQEARTKYNESLAYEESASLRAQSDTRLASLGMQIQIKQNEIIVRQVRELKTQARREYYNGNFDRAETILTQAENLWAITNVDKDEEIVTLLALVNTALSMKTGRVIPPSAPLYPEMSQILSIAQQYFKQGGDLLQAGRTHEGRAVLEQALQKLQEVQLVYPLNQEASLLTLRIQQILDPDGFSELFARRIENVRTNYTVRGREQQSYTDLLDLYEINPSYPGLSQLIYNVEIDLGIRQKPQDRTAITRSENLTSQARGIVNSAGRDEVRLQSALSLLDEAISLNPNNDEALLLKDRIQILIGGRAVIVLSSEDEAKYQSAIVEMQNNNIITANALVEQLLQKAENRRSSKIIDLQRKIKALL
ncbi:MAG: hypothetical protein J6I73_01090 [Treponema sp.]|nr:hypothetical protein [Treponema sp.]